MRSTATVRVTEKWRRHRDWGNSHAAAASRSIRFRAVVADTYSNKEWSRPKQQGSRPNSRVRVRGKGKCRVGRALCPFDNPQSALHRHHRRAAAVDRRICARARMHASFRASARRHEHTGGELQIRKAPADRRPVGPVRSAGFYDFQGAASKCWGQPIRFQVRGRFDRSR